MKKMIAIKGMSCMNCAMHVTKELYKVTGVKSAVVNLEQKNAIVESDSELPDKALVDAVEDAGYTATSVTVAG